MRIFKKPIVIFSADDYYYLIDDNSIWLESILTKDIYINSLSAIIRHYKVGIFEFGNSPSHTQAVEWQIQLVSKTSKFFAKPIDCDGRIHVTLIECQLIPYFKSK